MTLQSYRVSRFWFGGGGGQHLGTMCIKVATLDHRLVFAALGQRYVSGVEAWFNRCFFFRKVHGVRYCQIHFIESC